MALTVPLSAADVVSVQAGFLRQLQTEAVIASQTNREYTGQIVGQGSSVKVILPDLVTLTDYVPNVTTIVPSAVSDTDVTLTVNQAKYFAVKLDDVTANAGAAGELEAVAASAGETTANDVDAHIATVWAAGAGIDLGTDVDISGTGAAYDYLLDVMVAAAGKGKDRVAIVPTAFKAQLLRDNRFVGSGFTAQYNAQIGQVAGIAIVEDEAATDTVLVRSHREAVASVVSLSKVERYRPESAFADAVKGLVVYGAKVIRPGSTGAGTVIFAPAAEDGE